MRRFIYSSLEFDETGIRLRSHRTSLISGTANTYGSRLIEVVWYSLSRCIWKAEFVQGILFKNDCCCLWSLFPTEKSPPLELIYERALCDRLYRSSWILLCLRKQLWRISMVVVGFLTHYQIKRFFNSLVHTRHKQYYGVGAVRIDFVDRLATLESYK